MKRPWPRNRRGSSKRRTGWPIPYLLMTLNSRLRLQFTMLRLAPLGNAHRVQGEARHFRSRLLHGSADVLFDEAAGEIDVACQHGVAQFEMLVPAPRAGMDHGQPM